MSCVAVPHPAPRAPLGMVKYGELWGNDRAHHQPLGLENYGIWGIRGNDRANLALLGMVNYSSPFSTTNP